MGECALTVEFENEITPETNALVRALDQAIAVADLPGIVETVPGFRSLLVIYEPETIDCDTLIDELGRLAAEPVDARPVSARSWTVPVAYGYPGDDDLREVAIAKGLTPQEVIALHSGAEYRVYVVGFVPGLPVLGGLPEALHLPRRPDSRPDIPTGRVMIGGMQGLIVPMTMPTGYYGLGQTPLRPFDRAAANPFLFRPGDRIRFKPITERELEQLERSPSLNFLDPGA